MDWIVAVSPAESDRGELLPETERRGYEALRTHGCVVLRGVLPLATVDAMYQDYLSRYGSLAESAMRELARKPPPNRFFRVGAERYDITLRMNGAFGRPEVFANGILRRFLTPLLGEDMRLNSFSTVVSYPGAAIQHIHRDHAHLFVDPSVDPNLPVYAVNVAVPLIDVDLEIGPTGIWPGSHRWPAQAPLPQPETVTAFEFQRGDCILLDYRTLHVGLPNRSNRVRPIVYIVYSRSWFFDEINHPMRVPLDMPFEDYAVLPDPIRLLLMRVFTNAMRARWKELDAPAPAAARSTSDPSSWGQVGRNEPCPCGSGKRYKHCHGQLVSAS